MNGAYTQDQNDSPPLTMRSNEHVRGRTCGLRRRLRLDGRRGSSQHFEGQIVAADLAVPRSNDQSFDDVLELANVARPRMFGRASAARPPITTDTRPDTASRTDRERTAAAPERLHDDRAAAARECE